MHMNFSSNVRRRLRESSEKDCAAFADNKPVGIKAQMFVSEPMREKPPSETSIFVVYDRSERFLVKNLSIFQIGAGVVAVTIFSGNQYNIRLSQTNHPSPW